MASILDGIDPALTDWIAAQHLFFVATAPSSVEGMVNLSPKGYDSFRVLDPHTVAYLDLTGSGVETIAHVQENGRITFMFCAFEGAPRIVRLHGRGEVVLPADPGFAELAARFPTLPGVRSVVRVRVERVSDSCGYAVPLLTYRGERRALTAWAEKMGGPGLVEYRDEKNARSIDGLPALTPAAG